MGELKENIKLTADNIKKAEFILMLDFNTFTSKTAIESDDKSPGKHAERGKRHGTEKIKNGF